MNKLFFIILIILVSGCGFKIVNLSETNDFSIIDVNTNGDKKINYIIKNSILYASKSNSNFSIISQDMFSATSSILINKPVLLEKYFFKFDIILFK